MQQARGISGCREFVKNDEEELTTPAPSLRTGIKKPRNHGTFQLQAQDKILRENLTDQQAFRLKVAA